MKVEKLEEKLDNLLLRSEKDRSFLVSLSDPDLTIQELQERVKTAHANRYISYSDELSLLIRKHLEDNP